MYYTGLTMDYFKKLISFKRLESGIIPDSLLFILHKVSKQKTAEAVFCLHN